MPSTVCVKWLRYEADAPYPDIVQNLPPIAFEVDDIHETIKGKHVIIPLNSPCFGVVVAFIEDDGAPIEFLQIDRSMAEPGI